MEIRLELRHLLQQDFKLLIVLVREIHNLSSKLMDLLFEMLHLHFQILEVNDRRADASRNRLPGLERVGNGSRAFPRRRLQRMFPFRRRRFLLDRSLVRSGFVPLGNFDDGFRLWKFLRGLDLRNRIDAVERFDSVGKLGLRRQSVALQQHRKCGDRADKAEYSYINPDIEEHVGHRDECSQHFLECQHGAY